MEFTSRTVTHPNPRISREDALKSLYEHPQFKPGTRVVDIERKGKRWVAKLEEPKAETKEADTKEAADPPAFPETDSPAAEDTPSEPKPSKDDTKSEKKDDSSKSDTPSLEKVFELVQQIAEAVGVSAPSDGEGKGDGKPAEEVLPDLPPPEDAPPAESKGEGKGEKHEEHHGPRFKLKPGETLPNQTPIGAPAFSSTNGVEVPEDHPWREVIGKKASFTASNETDATVAQAKRELDELGAPYGYKVKQIVEGRNDDGKRIVRALVSRY